MPKNHTRIRWRREYVWEGRWTDTRFGRFFLPKMTKDRHDCPPETNEVKESFAR